MLCVWVTKSTFCLQVLAVKVRVRAHPRGAIFRVLIFDSAKCPDDGPKPSWSEGQKRRSQSLSRIGRDKRSAPARLHISSLNNFWSQPPPTYSIDGMPRTARRK